MKYARPITIDNGGTPQIRMIDIFDTSDYDPRPEWGQTDDALLSKIFIGFKDQWIASGEWFVEVAEGVQNAAVYNGGGYMDINNYINPGS